MGKIVVTGGAGYIGSHTIVDLIEHGFDVISVDNFCRSLPNAIKNVEQLVGKPIQNYPIDLCDKEATRTLFTENDIDGIIHFAALKLVNESVDKPLEYYQNNLQSQINLLQLVTEFNIPHFVFSSSCSVYGNVEKLPVTEDSPLARAESPYGNTKKIGEQILRDCANIGNIATIALRYFNPIGAHPTGIIGENPTNRPENLMPIITEAASGKREKLTVFGDDYDTKDGSCVRDYIHVADIAHAHTLAIQYLQSDKNSEPFQVINLGSGEGSTVLEMITAFEKATGIPVPYEIGERRAGDLVSIYADNSLAKKILSWTPRFSLEDMMRTAWAWENKKDNNAL